DSPPPDISSLSLHDALPIFYTRENFADRVNEITGRAKVDVVYDSVGKDTFIRSFDCLKPFGVLALFGQSSGIVEPLETRILTEKGSLYLTRPAIWEHVRTREALLETARDVFDVVASGDVKIVINQRYPLKDAAQAHRDVEDRKTSGSTVLVV